MHPPTLCDTTFQQNLAAQGLVVTGSSPEETAATIQLENKEWSAAARMANVSLD